MSVHNYKTWHELPELGLGHTLVHLTRVLILLTAGHAEGLRILEPARRKRIRECYSSCFINLIKRVVLLAPYTIVPENSLVHTKG